MEGGRHRAQGPEGSPRHHTQVPPAQDQQLREAGVVVLDAHCEYHAVVLLLGPGAGGEHGLAVLEAVLAMEGNDLLQVVVVLGKKTSY